MKGKNSYILTIIIYGLIIYIGFNFINMGMEKIVSDSMLENVIKNLTKESVLSVGYITKLDSEVINKNDNKLELLAKIINISVYDYTSEKIPVNTAENLDIRTFSIENTRSENSDADNEKDIENESDLAGSKDINTENDIDSDKTVTDIENNNDSDSNVDNQSIETSVRGFEKVQDIKTEELTYDYLMSKFYTVVSSTVLYPEDIDASKLMSMDMKMQTENNKPQILIYHTHSQEAFTDSISGDSSTTIVGVGDYLTKLLTEEYGYNVIHLKDSFDYVNGVLDRHKAYDYAYEKIAQVLADNPSIEVVIDLHRDGVNENLHLVTEINGKQTAKIMFFNGISRLKSIGEIGYLYNPYREQNLAFSLQMKVLAEEYFTGFTRKNYIQAYQYNLHLRPKSLLIEAGAQTNTVEEEMNAMEPLAKLLDLELKGE